MRPTHYILPILLVCCQTWGQTTAPSVPSGMTAPPSMHPEPIEPRIENIVVEDSSARINELRVGGETKSITVQPKSGLPAYQVAPKTGERTWKVLGF